MKINIYNILLILFILLILVLVFNTTGLLIFLGIAIVWFIFSPLINTVNDPNTTSSQKLLAVIVMILFGALILYGATFARSFFGW
jgi:hypothetical protein